MNLVVKAIFFLSVLYFLYCAVASIYRRQQISAYQSDLIELRTEISTLSFVLTDLQTDLNVHKKITTIEKTEKFFKQSRNVEEKLNIILTSLFHDINAPNHIKNSKNIYNQLVKTRNEIGVGFIIKMLDHEDIKQLIKNSEIFPDKDRVEMIELISKLIKTLLDTSDTITELLVKDLRDEKERLELKMLINSGKLIAAIATYQLVSIYGDKLADYSKIIFEKLKNLNYEDIPEFLEALKLLQFYLENGVKMATMYGKVFGNSSLILF
jgi:hypothetical protein